MNAVTELLTVLCDALLHGDMRGHLAAWWSVVSGQVTPTTRFTLPSVQE